MLLQSDWAAEQPPVERRTLTRRDHSFESFASSSGQLDLLNTLGALPVAYGPAVSAPTPGPGTPLPAPTDPQQALFDVMGGLGDWDGGGGIQSGPDFFVGPNVRANNRVTCPNPNQGRTQSEVSMVYEPYSGAVVIGYNDSRGFGCSAQAPGYQVLGWASSQDGGFTFDDGGPLPGRTQLSGDPWLAAGPDGTIYLASLFNGTANLAVLRGTPTESGIQWSNPTAISGDGAYDKEAMAVDPVTGNIYVTYTRFGGPNGLWSVRSTNGGQSFERAVPIRTGNQPQLQGSYPVVGPNGEVFVAYNIGYPNNTGVGFAVSYDQGQTYFDFGQVGSIANFLIPGHNRGLHTNFPQIAVDNSGGPNTGNLYLTWSTQRPGTDGDVIMIRSTDGGASWSPPMKINDDTTTGIQFFPTITVDSNGYVNIAFYDRRENPGTAITNMYFAQSRDGGESFLPNIKITDQPSTWNCCTDMFPNFGDYIHSIAAGPYIGVTWADARDGDPDAYMAWIVPLE